MRQRQMRGGEDQKWIEVGKPVLGSICALWRALWTQGQQCRQGGYGAKGFERDPKDKNRPTGADS
jgi:hypothetical protein